MSEENPTVREKLNDAVASTVRVAYEREIARKDDALMVAGIATAVMLVTVNIFVHTATNYRLETWNLWHLIFVIPIGSGMIATGLGVSFLARNLLRPPSIPRMQDPSELLDIVSAEEVSPKELSRKLAELNAKVGDRLTRQLAYIGSALQESNIQQFENNADAIRMGIAGLVLVIVGLPGFFVYQQTVDREVVQVRVIDGIEIHLKPKHP